MSPARGSDTPRFEVHVREAKPADAAALADIELRSPIVMGDTTLTFDRRRDYFAASRLMEDVTIVLAEVDGRVASVEWAARHPARIGGVDYRMAIFIHLRVLPEHQGKGLWGRMVEKLSETYPRTERVDCGYAYGARTNTAIQHGFRDVAKWTRGPIRVRLPAGEQSGSRYGRPARPEDAALIVEILNASHERDEMYVPYTVDTLRARLERAPDLYSWEHFWIGDGAVVGVWPSGKCVRVVTERGGQRAETTPGLVLDYGLLEGADEDLARLLRAWCGWLAVRDHTHLSIFTSEASRGFHVIESLDGQLEPFDLWTPGIEEPEGADRRGLYVDQVYF